MFTVAPGSAISLTASLNAWHTQSAGTPPGATGAELSISMGAGGAFTVRKKVASGPDTFTNSNAMTAGERLRVRVGLNASGQFDWYSTAGSTAGYLIGYYNDESVFFDNAVALPTWQTPPYTYDLTASAPGAIAAFITCYNQSGFNASAGGLTDPNDSWNPPTVQTQDWIIGLKNCQFTVRAGSTPAAWYLRGYMTKGFVWHPNARQITSPTSWSPLPEKRSAAAYLYMLTGGGGGVTFKYACAPGYTAPPVPTQVSFTSFGQNQWVCGAPPYEVVTNAVSTYELGYFLQPTPAKLDPFTSMGLGGISSGSRLAYYSESGTSQRRSSDTLGSRTGKRGVRK